MDRGKLLNLEHQPGVELNRRLRGVRKLERKLHQTQKRFKRTTYMTAFTYSRVRNWPQIIDYFKYTAVSRPELHPRFNRPGGKTNTFLVNSTTHKTFAHAKKALCHFFLERTYIPSCCHLGRSEEGAQGRRAFPDDVAPMSYRPLPVLVA